jgi:hypothetical protein
LTISARYGGSWPVILATGEAEIRRIIIQSQPTKNLPDPNSTHKNLGEVVLACHQSYRGNINRKIIV